MQIKKGIPVFGEPLDDAVRQIETVNEGAFHAALMADHHVGYSMPIGGVAGYFRKISPSGVGYDIACGNAAVQTSIHISEFTRDQYGQIADEIANTISFGVGRKNPETVEAPEVFNHAAWSIEAVRQYFDLAQSQLGTVGAGNHYVDVLVDRDGWLWIANHFGSRGLGHKIATHFIKAAGGKDGMFVEPVVLNENSDLGQEYLAAMDLAGKYAYAGRDWVINKVAQLMGAGVMDHVHNHHNYAWKEKHLGLDLWVVRKGATPLHANQRGFIGGSMGDISVVVRGRPDVGESTESVMALHSAPHGAGRIMSRTQAAGKMKWGGGKKTRISEGQISEQMMMDALQKKGVILRGGYMDEAPQVYKDLRSVLEAHEATLEIEHVLEPVIVVMAPNGIIDPYKD